MNYSKFFLENIKPLVPPNRLDEFLKFIKTGEASDEFLSYLKIDPLCKEAVQMVLDRQEKVFKSIGEMIRDVKEPKDSHENYDGSFMLDVFGGMVIGILATVILFSLIVL